MKGNLSRILWGIVLILLGIVWGINALGIAEINVFFEGWWTLFIIIPCAVSLFDSSENGKFGNLIGLIFGIVLLLACRDVISFDIIWKLFFPVIIICIGLSMVFTNSIKTKINEKIKTVNEGDLENIVVTFSEQNVNKNNEKFTGANLDSVFGSITLDLTTAKIENESVIKASAIFGGIEILVPNDIEVKVKSTAIFGGISNKAKNNNSKKVIYIDGLCLFGGIDIK